MTVADNKIKHLQLLSSLEGKGKGKGAVPNAGRRRGAHLPFVGL